MSQYITTKEEMREAVAAGVAAAASTHWDAVKAELVQIKQENRLQSGELSQIKEENRLQRLRDESMRQQMSKHGLLIFGPDDKAGDDEIFSMLNECRIHYKDRKRWRKIRWSLWGGMALAIGAYLWDHAVTLIQNARSK